MSETVQPLRWSDKFYEPFIRFIPAKISPNHLSMIRGTVFPPVIILLMWLELHKSVGLIYLFLALLDGFDGALARITGQESEAGKIIDPTADKILNFSVFLGFLFCIDSSLYLSLIMIIIMTDTILFFIELFKYLVTILPQKISKKSLFYKALKIEKIKNSVSIKKTGANSLGKAKMISQIITLSILLFFSPATIIYANISILQLCYILLPICILLGIGSLIGHIRVIKLT